MPSSPISISISLCISLCISLSRVGAGLYCLDESVLASNLYYCNDNHECVLQEECSGGCIKAPPGKADVCRGESKKIASESQSDVGQKSSSKAKNVYCNPFSSPLDHCPGTVPGTFPYMSLYLLLPMIPKSP